MTLTLQILVTGTAVASATIGLNIWLELRRPPKCRCLICHTPLPDMIPTCDECRWNKRELEP